MSAFLRWLKEKNLWSVAALVILVVGVVSSVFWQPAPNRVRVPIESNPEQTVLQVYYRYGFPGPGSFFEYYSDKELIHQNDGVLVAEFELPGWRKLRAIRLDLGREVRSFQLGPVEFGYELAYKYYPLFSLNGEEILERWQKNDQIASGVVNEEGWTVETSGKDAYLVFPVSRDEWLGSLAPEDLWVLRGFRLLIYAMVSGLVFLAGRLVRSGWLLKAGSPQTPRWNRWWGAVFFIGLLALGFVVYEPFLIFEKLYLFKDVATDSVDVFWPVYMHISHYFRTEGYPLWSFSIGTGQGLFNWIGDLFLFILYALPPVDIAFALGWVQLLKTLIAGLLFLGWLRMLGIGRYAASVGAVGLVFSAHMVIRGNWTHYASEVVMVAFALFAFECFLRKKIWHLIPLAILFLVIRGVFHTYVWSILFFSYALLRLWMEAGWKPKWIGLQVLRLGGCYLLGLGLSAFFLFPNLAEILSSPRVSGGESTVSGFASRGFFGINDAEEWLSSLYGLFAPDIMGRGNFYSGWRNYLEGPHLYVGTIMLLLIPQAFLGRSRRVKVVLGLALLAVVLYLFVPYARYFMNAFAGDYYKTSSFWVSLVIAGTGALALDNVVRRRRLNLGLLIVTLVLCLVALGFLKYSEFVMEWLRVNESRRVYRQVIILLFAYSGALVLMRSERQRSLGLLLLPLLLGWEVYQFAGQSTQDRLTLRGDSLETGAYYFDDTYSAIRMIEQADDEFYRVEKGNVSVHLNDPLGQGYNGLSSYYSFNAGGYLSFLGPQGFDVDYLVPGHRSSYVAGPGKRFALATLLSTKYFIARDWGDSVVPPAYQLWGRAGDALIYENTCFIPFGSIYFQRIEEDVVWQYPPESRDLLAFAAAIVPEEIGMTDASLVPELAQSEVKAIAGRGTNQTADGWVNTYTELAHDLASTSVTWDEFGENRMEGSVRLEQPGIAFFSIPDNAGWKAEINGEAAEFFPIHFGFKALVLPSGDNQISIEYFPPYMKAGMFASGGSILVMVGLIVWPFVRRKSVRKEQSPD
ncbi:YfhO family protein [Puniceicoccus vermicola]|uniref:YfhO family protein n=1 Tax=Puniceicoccus vermicola TaxID=388746 RepID=A0A7X1AWK0_9BACT|nr:YfhO family protein [Puniceicoccus vermicola]MBC2601119.1 YfhO family protein [Puniceicoccus vermicola]